MPVRPVHNDMLSVTFSELIPRLIRKNMEVKLVEGTNVLFNCCPYCGSLDGKLRRQWLVLAEVLLLQDDQPIIHVRDRRLEPPIPQLKRAESLTQSVFQTKVPEKDEPV